jgi:hypothetical protein
LQPVSAQPPGHGVAPSAAGLPSGPQPWRLVLSSGAKVLVAVIIVVGALVYGGNIAFNVNRSVSQLNAIDTVSTAHIALRNQLAALSKQNQACQTEPDVLSCVTRVDRQAAQDLGSFASTLSTTAVPPFAAAAAAQLVQATYQAQSAFQQLGTATSVAQYQQIAASVNVTMKLRQFDTAYTALGHALGAR